ncbi:MAG TPA: phospholipase D-like domain-containing protein [Candidatus Deferrimicrobium sp.]|nr:phospholipase D-like domain-containing protein [Candidatus Deferrimicrobium sp.]
MQHGLGPVLKLSGDDGICAELKRQFRWADAAFLCVSYARHQAYNLLSSEITELLRRGGSLRALFDMERFFTDPTIIMELCTTPGDSECRGYFRQAAGGADEHLPGALHAKVYMFRKSRDVRALIGSSNLTVDGLLHNVETNLLLQGNTSQPFFKSLFATFEELWDSPFPIRPEDHYEVIEQYERLYNLVRSSQTSIERRARQQKHILSQLVIAAKDQLHGTVTTDIAYLMGLIAGGGYVIDDHTIKIRYHKGMFNKGTKDEGFIFSPGISAIRMRQAIALRKDVVGICDRLTRFFRRTGTKDRVTSEKRSDFDYEIFLHLDSVSQHAETLRDFLSRCGVEGKRVVPVFPSHLPQFQDRIVLASFIRGYADIRSRISPTDREGVEGPLRVALSFSRGADDFSQEFKSVLERTFGVEHVNLLLGTKRGRETMLRIDPVELHKLGPQKFFSITWKQLLLADYSHFNQSNFAQKYA